MAERRPRGQSIVENAIIRKLVALFQKVLAAVLRLLRARRSRSFVDTTHILQPIRDVLEKVSQILYEHSNDAMRYGANRVRRHFGDYSSAGVEEEEVRGDESLARSREQAEYFVGKVVQRIDDVLLGIETDALLQDEPPVRAGEIETSVVEDEMGSIMDYEIKSLARRNAVASENAGAFREMERRGVAGKKWKTREDEQVRHSHEELHNEVVSLYDFFDNGLQFPGDLLHGDPSDWMNCRCWIVPASLGELRKAISA